MNKTFAMTALSLACISASASASVHVVFPIASPLTQGFSQPLQVDTTSYNSTDFYIDNFTNFTFNSAYVTAYVNFFPGKIMTTGTSSTSGYPLAKMLSVGTLVGPSTFGTANYNPILADEHYGQGQWYNSSTPVEGFFGMEYANGFDANNNALVNFAYVDVRVTPLPNQSAVVDILGWAFESTPNTALTVAALPEPSALSVLGIAGLAMVRRRRA